MKDTIKEKMDAIPQNFDRQALWDSINEPKKPKRVFFFQFLFGICILLIIGIVVKSNNSWESGSQNSSIVILEDSNTTTLTEKENTIKNHNEVVVSDINSIEEKIMHSDNEIIPSTNSLRKHNDSKRTTNTTLEVKSSTISIESASIETTESTQNYDPFKTNINRKDLTKSVINSKVLDGATFVDNDDYTNKVSTILLDIPKVKLLFPVLKIPHSEPTRDLLAIILGPEFNSYHNNHPKQKFWLSLGIGFDNHEYSNNIFGHNRKNQEKGLESRNIRIGYSTRFYKSFSIESGLYLSRAQTNNRISQRLENYTYSTNKNLEYDFTKTTYSHFNEYYRLDLTLALGYEISVNEKWRLNPIIGGGYNLRSFQNGHIWDQNSEINLLEENLAYDSSSKVFVFYAMSIDRKIATNYFLGARVEIQSTRKLAQFANYNHLIRPTFLSVYLGKTF